MNELWSQINGAFICVLLLFLSTSLIWTFTAWRRGKDRQRAAAFIAAAQAAVESMSAQELRELNEDVERAIAVARASAAYCPGWINPRRK